MPKLGTRKERYLAAAKACTVLLFLMQSRPPVPHLYKSFEDYFDTEDAVASWILCCMVNSFDDFVRSLGIRCLTSFLQVVALSASSPSIGLTHDNAEFPVPVLSEPEQSMTQPQMNVARRLSKTVQNVGTGLGVIGSGTALSIILASKKANIGIVYKLLWHLLKCHRERLGDLSHAALVNLLVDDGPSITSSLGTLALLDGIVIPDNNLSGGYILHSQWASLPLTEVGIDSSQNIRNGYALSTIMRLLRFVSVEMKERWLFDLLALIRVSKTSFQSILPCHDWQPTFFHLVSEVIEEINSHQYSGSTKGNGNEMQKKFSGDQVQSNIDTKVKYEFNLPIHFNIEQTSSVELRYDLSLKLYSSLLGQCVRQGGEKSFHAIEQAASLQRVCVNGHEVFSVVLSHLLAELVEHGTVMDIDAISPASEGQPIERNRALKQSARIVTKSILSDGAEGMDMASAVKQWRCLRHLCALTVAVVTASGFGVAELFDYRNQSASAIDSRTGGLHGIRLPDGPVSGISTSQAFVEPHFNSHDEGNGADGQRNERESYRMMCVVLSSQLLSLLDAFIFPDTLDASQPTSQLHGLALVRSIEPRLGQAQGPLLASLLRLSLLLLTHLEPSSVKFLQCCSRLRCFLHWTLELIRESVAEGGYNAAFHELTAQMDRMVLAAVLQCHRALSRCSAVLMEIESSPVEKYFKSTESRQKNYRRLFRATLELREVVLAAYRGRNEVLRAALSLQAYEALQAGLEESTATGKKWGSSKSKVSSKDRRGSSSKEASLRAFLANVWVTRFHDVDIIGDIAVPEQVSNKQIYRNRTASDQGLLAIEELAKESKHMVEDYSRALNAPFEAYCEDQRQWTETDAVRDLEYAGDLAVKRLAGRFRTDLNETIRLASLRSGAAGLRWNAIARNVIEPWEDFEHWKLAKHPDRLHRRILLVRNRNFDDHEEASYEYMLGKERDKALKDREERLRRKKEAQVLSASLKYAKTGVVHFEELDDEERYKRQEGAESKRMGPNALIRQVSIRASAGIVPFAELMADIDDEDITLEPEEEQGLYSVKEGHESGTELTEHSGSALGADWDETDQEALRHLAEKSEEEVDRDAWARAFIWSAGEHAVQNFNSVVLVTLETTTDGELLLTTHGVYFHATGDETSVMTKQKVNSLKAEGPEGKASEQRDLRWRLSRLTEVHGRRHMLRAQAVEMLFADTQELFINFNGGTHERDKFYSKLRSSCKVCNCLKF